MRAWFSLLVGLADFLCADQHVSLGGDVAWREIHLQLHTTRLALDVERGLPLGHFTCPYVSVLNTAILND